MREFGGKYAWCDCEIITRGQVTGQIVKDPNNGKIHWIRDGVRVVSYLATVDHLIPLSEGGTNPSVEPRPSLQPVQR